MARPAPSWTSGGVPRGAAAAISAVLGAAALCLVVFGTGQRQLQLGVLLGLWSALIAACLVFRTGREPEENVASAQHVERALAEQLAALREEVAALRAELVDKLGGQLRLERIETTRVIGSDLEALQHEIRRLAAVNRAVEPDPAGTRYQGRRRADGDPAGQAGELSVSEPAAVVPVGGLRR